MAWTFDGPGTTLTAADLERTAGDLGVTPIDLWTVIEVETSGFGFLSDRRPQILFERHWFHRLTGGRFASHGDICAPQAGGYGPAGAHQYDRIARALALDEEAALKSASWGLGQIMGFNAEQVGFADVRAMVLAMIESEAAQLDGIAGFIRAKALARPLRDGDWEGFARVYNGPDFARHGYQTKLAARHATLAVRGMPNFAVRQAQAALRYLGYDPGPVDGRAGAWTLAALHTWQGRAGRPPADRIDAETIEALRAAVEATRTGGGALASPAGGGGSSALRSAPGGPMKTVQEMLAAADAVVPRISPEEAKALVGRDDVVFLDVREPGEVATSGKVPGALAIPRGLVEFRADPASPLHDAAFDRAKTVVAYCASGGRSALVGKTLKDMGYAKVLNLGGFKGWLDAGGAVEKG